MREMKTLKFPGDTEPREIVDAKAREDISTLSEEIANLQTSGLTTAQVNALDGMFKACAFIKDDISAEYNAFCTAFGIEAATITGISATYSGGNVAVGTAVTDLTGIVVTANYSDGSKRTVTGYTLSGTIAEGSNTITVTYEGMTTTFTVTGVAEEVTITSISATYSGGSVTVGTAVADLTGVVVTAHYSDGTSKTVTGYTMSGTIAEGSNTISVSYGGATTTFTVTGIAESAGDGGYNENVAWEFEWDASSGVAPDGLTGSQGAPRTTFAENNEYMTAANAVLNFDYTGTSTLEVTACFADAQYNRPQIGVSNATHAGVKLYMSETTDTLMSSVTGGAAAVSTDPTYRTEFKAYRIVNNNGEYALYIDGALVANGTGRTNDSYIEGTGIFCGTYSIQLKNIKFSKSV